MAIITDDRRNSGYIFYLEVLGIQTTNFNGLEDEIEIVKWKLEGRLKNCPVCGLQHVGAHEGSTPLKDITEGVRVPFSDLTENDVLEWVEEITQGDHNNLHPFEVIHDQIDLVHKKSRFAYNKDLPWAGKL
jgi:hypothetical protein